MDESIFFHVDGHAAITNALSNKTLIACPITALAGCQAHSAGTDGSTLNGTTEQRFATADTAPLQGLLRNKATDGDVSVRYASFAVRDKGVVFICPSSVTLNYTTVHCPRMRY